jgi:hypothetical protein
MGERRYPTRRQRWVGAIVLGMAAATAVAPIMLIMALRGPDSPLSNPLLVTAAIIWMISLFAYRGFSLAHERWRRKTLRREIVAARKARLDSSETFQDQLNQQFAILERIADISDSLLVEGIVDPAQALDSVRRVNAHAHEAQGLVEDAIAEARIETGSQSFNMESVDTRTEIEHVAGPFIRSGYAITTSGTQHFAHTDRAVLRLILRGLVTRAVDVGADDISISVARDGALVVCTVADDGPDRSHLGLHDLTPLTRSLVEAVDGDLNFSRAFGRNQYAISLPVGVAPANLRPQGTPMDVLGSRSAASPAPENPAPAKTPAIQTDEAIAFAVEIERDQVQTVADRRKAPVELR